LLKETSPALHTRRCRPDIEPLDTFYVKDGGPLGIWRQWAPGAHGQAMKGGHFFPEENPDDTAALLNKFVKR